MAETQAKQLFSILQAEYKTSADLLESLKLERQALIDADIDMINQLAEKKQPLVLKLELLGKQRENVLRSVGFNTDKAGLAAFISNQPEKQSQLLNQLLAKLKNMATACRQQNQLNGGVLNVNRQYVQRAMSIFRGKDLNAEAYGPGGEYTNQVVRQPLLGRV
jgi:flagella synthesis protein FlgN